MKSSQWIIASGLLFLVLLTVFGLIVTSGSNSPVLSKASSSDNESLVDQRPLQTARKLSTLAAGPDEQRLSQETLRLGDHEVDLAFADALREAQEHPPQLSPEARELSKRVAASEAAVQRDQDRIKGLQKLAAAANETSKDRVQQQIDIAQAQLAMDQDELDDAKEDLTRAGGDAQGKIQRLLDEHEAGQHAAASNAQASAVPDYTATNLAPQLRAYLSLGTAQLALGTARDDASTAAKLLSHEHAILEQHVQQESTERAAIKQSTPTNTPASPPASAADTITSLRHFANDQKAMSDLDKRVEDEQELAANYASWISLVQSHRRTALHGMLQSALWILLVILIVYLADRTIDHYFVDPAPEKTRLRTMRGVIKFAVQAVGLVAILFIIFGAPSQTPTILGLAGAGLTVALKDFIVAFFGWFVLMGRNGIRVGDWVEINGVGGEVVEIGLLRTVLLETGNWTDSGHPTGRRVAFVNSYAVEGHYFNFSTSGQWLWDEIKLMIPGGQNPYPVLDSVQKLVTKETEPNAREAEQEWQRATTRYRVKSFTAVPSVDVRPTSSGVEVVVRYITRAHERYDMRARLYHALVNLLHKKHIEAASNVTASSAQ